MLTGIRARISYANVVATIALFVALGGSSYAALQLPRNSVGPRQLKKNAVTAPKIKRNAVTGSKVRSNAVTGSKVNEGTLGKVPLAAIADELANIDYNSYTVPNPPGTRTSIGGPCDSGLRVVGGGIRVDDDANQFIIDSHPSGTDGWAGTVENVGTGTPNLRLTVICASADLISASP